MGFMPDQVLLADAHYGLPADRPPSTMYTPPVQKLLSSLARNSINFATSSGFPYRWRGMRASKDCLVCCTVTAELSAAATRISSNERIIRVSIGGGIGAAAVRTRAAAPGSRAVEPGIRPSQFLHWRPGGPAQVSFKRSSQPGVLYQFGLGQHERRG